MAQVRLVDACGEFEEGRITNADYRACFGVSRDQAKAQLARLAESNVVELKGRQRSAHYVRGAAWPITPDWSPRIFRRRCSMLITWWQER